MRRSQIMMIGKGYQFDPSISIARLASCSISMVSKVANCPSFFALKVTVQSRVEHATIHGSGERCPEDDRISSNAKMVLCFIPLLYSPLPSTPSLLPSRWCT